MILAVSRTESGTLELSHFSVCSAQTQIRKKNEIEENVNIHNYCQKSLIKTRPQIQQAVQGGMPRGEKWYLAEFRLPDHSCLSITDTCPTLALQHQLPAGIFL